MKIRQLIPGMVVVLVTCFAGQPTTSLGQPSQADDDTLQTAGIRKLQSKHLTLYTDLSGPAVDALPRVFDLAIPEWARFFRFEPNQLQDWHMIACVMRDRQRFATYGLLPNSLPPFLHGYQAGDRIWVVDQPSDYYRRHLLLHEGTHAVMHRRFRSIGPAWYGEGIAELLGTHRLNGNKLELGYLPREKKEVQQWGRIKLVREKVDAGRALPILKIMDYRARDFLEVESYAWCWALSAFCHGHPLLKDQLSHKGILCIGSVILAQIWIVLCLKSAKKMASIKSQILDESACLTRHSSTNFPTNCELSWLSLLTLLLNEAATRQKKQKV